MHRVTNRSFSHFIEYGLWASIAFATDYHGPGVRGAHTVIGSGMPFT